MCVCTLHCIHVVSVSPISNSNHSEGMQQTRVCVCQSVSFPRSIYPHPPCRKRNRHASKFYIMETLTAIKNTLILLVHVLVLVHSTSTTTMYYYVLVLLLCTTTMYYYVLVLLLCTTTMYYYVLVLVLLMYM